MKLALTFARLSKTACVAFPDIGDIGGAARAMVRNVGDTKAIIFRGTDDIAAWLADLEYEIVNTPVGMVHEGVYEAFKSIEQELRGHRPKYIAGHSLGGALAIIYAAWLCKAGTPPTAVYAFDPPRICADDEVAHLLRVNNVRVIITRNGSDLVPTLPPQLLAEWTHPAEVVRIGRRKFFSNLKDHSIESIVRSLEKM